MDFTKTKGDISIYSGVSFLILKRNLDFYRINIRVVIISYAFFAV